MGADCKGSADRPTAQTGCFFAARPVSFAPFDVAPIWRGGRVVECAGFEIRFTVLP